MNLSKQFVNLIGAVLALGILAAGVFLIALPLVGQAATTAADAALVAQTNQGYETQIAGLRDNEKDLAQIQASVSELQGEIPADPQLDDIFEIVGAAANTAGVTIVTTSVNGSSAWSPRAALTPDSLVLTDGTSGADAPATDTATTDGATTDGATTDTATTDASADAGTDGTATDGAATPPTEPKVQIAFTITLIAPSPAQAQAFIDALGDGNRLIAIVHSTLSPNETAYDMTVNATAFVRTQN